MKTMITGGSRGIGKAISLELAKNGHDVLLVAKTQKTLEQTADEIRSVAPVQVKHFACDLSRVTEIKNLYDFCIESDFRPNVLILNAGIFIEGSLVDSRLDDFNATLNVNLVAIYNCVQMFADVLKANRNSKVILMGSTAGHEAYPVGALYGVAKWALRGYAVNLRQEFMKDRVGVTLITPGGTLTDLWAGEELPKNRLLEPSDIGKLIAAILTLSDQAVVEEIIVRPILGDMHE